MNAKDEPLTRLLDGEKQFIVPIFQRDYSWGTKQCQQLWDDIERVGSDTNTRAHFLGSVVYIGAESIDASVPRWLVIDGQQRLTTVTLLLAALRERLRDLDERGSGLPRWEQIEGRFLINQYETGDRRAKLVLRRADHESLTAIVNGQPLGESSALAVKENYEFFQECLREANIPTIYAGISKLVIVNVSLTRGQDDPQMIFESLNSTGLDLTQADLIRNFVLMRLEDDLQTRLYGDYWRPIEVAFGKRYRSEFDKFARDFLVLKLKMSKQIKADEIYHNFRQYFFQATKDGSVEDVLAELRRYASFYVRFSLNQESDSLLAEASSRLRRLVEVASTLMLRLHECHESSERFDGQRFKEAIELLESYVFRRSACDMQTRNLYGIFASFAHKIKEEDPLGSLKVALYRSGRKRRFPSDTEFREALETRDIYAMRTCAYLLERLENDSKEKIDTSSFTIEHVLPQNEDLLPAWREMLGTAWQTKQEIWLHRLGNLTLTGYNPEYSDRSFEDKKAMPNGFNDSPLRLNRFIREQDCWTEQEIGERGHALAEKATRIFPPLIADMDAVKAAELEELRAAAERYSVDSIKMDREARGYFNAIRGHIRILGENIVELCTEKSIVYRVYDHFVEVIPRSGYLTLLLNIDFDDIDDPSGLAYDASNRAFVMYASESGGVLFNLYRKMDVHAAVHLIRQAYQRVAE